MSMSKKKAVILFLLGLIGSFLTSGIVYGFIENLFIKIFYDQLRFCHIWDSPNYYWKIPVFIVRNDDCSGIKFFLLVIVLISMTVVWFKLSDVVLKKITQRNKW